jgi:hypothetical protein
MAMEFFDIKNHGNNTSATPANQTAIEIQRLTKRFQKFTAVDNLTLSIKYGEIFGLLGPNGSGKTMTVIPLSIGLSIPIFFISGAFGPATWGDPITAIVAQLQPVYYGIAVFQHAFHNFTTTSTGPSVDGFILVGFAVATVAGSTIALRSGRLREVAQ